MFFSTSFLILLTVTESTKVVLINMIAMWMMWTQLAPLGHLKIKVFWNKVHDAIISVHGVMRKDYHMTQIILKIWLFDQSLKI